MGDNEILNNLAGIVGGENAVPGDGAAEFSVGGVAPRIVLFPGTVEEVSEIMKAASRDSLSVDTDGLEHEERARRRRPARGRRALRQEAE